MKTHGFRNTLVYVIIGPQVHVSPYQ